MKIIKDGKMQGWFEGFLIVFGVLISYYSFMSENSSNIVVVIGIFGGLLVASIGGYSAQARTWQIKSFGNLTFPKDFKDIRQSKIIQIIEKFIDSVFTIMAISIFIMPLIYSSLKPYLEIYIACVTVFVGFVALIVIFIVIKELIRIYKANKKQDIHHDEIN